MKYFRTYKDYLNEQVTNESSDLLNEESDEQEALKNLKGEDRPKLHTFQDIKKPEINIYEPLDKKDIRDIDKYIVFNPETKHFVTIKAFNDYFNKVEAGEITEAIDKKTVKKITIPLKKVKAAIDSVKAKTKDGKPSDSTKTNSPTKELVGVDLFNKINVDKKDKKAQNNLSILKTHIATISDPKISDEKKAKAVQSLIDANIIRANAESDTGTAKNKLYLNLDGLEKKSPNKDALGSGVPAKNANHIINTIIKIADDHELEILGRHGVGKKTHTPAKISSKAAKRLNSLVPPPKPPATATKTIDIKSGKDSVEIGGVKYDTVKKPDEATKKKLLASYKERGIEKPEEEFELYLKAIDKHNSFIKNAKSIFGGEDKAPIINWYEVGSNPPKSINQKDQAGKNKMKRAILFELSDSLATADIEVSKKLKKLSDSAGKLNKEDFDKQLEEVFAALISSPDTRPGAPDMSEMMTALQKLNDGYEVYIPSASNFKLGDIIAIKNVASLNKNSTAKEIALGSQAIYSSLDLASVKYELGGASSSGGKIDSTTFNEPSAKESLQNILKMYDVIWLDKSSTFNESAIISKLMSYIKKYKLNDKKLTKEADDKTQSAIRTSSKIWIEAGKSPKEQKELKSKWKAYCLAGIVMEKIYNKYTDVQGFGNVSYIPSPKSGKTTKVETNETDGITSMCRLHFDHSQISKTGTPNNTFPTRMHNMSRDKFDRMRLVDYDQEAAFNKEHKKAAKNVNASKFSTYSQFLNEKNNNI